MSLIVPNSAEVLMLQYILGQATSGDLIMHLYTDTGSSPSESDTLATYSVNEVTDASYVSQTLSSVDWSIATVSGVSSATQPQVSFDFAASETVYGYYVTDSGNTNLLWVSEFTTPIPIPSGGGQIRITPVFEAE